MGHIIIALGILILFGYFAFLYVKYFKYPRRYFLNGKISCKKFADGTIKNYNNYMDISSEILPDGTTKQYEEDGSVSIEILPNKTKKYFYKDGTSFQKDPDKTEIWFDKHGNIESIKYPKSLCEFKPKDQTLKN
jgi:hypothetical protein